MRAARDLSGAILLCLFGSASIVTAEKLPGQLEIRYRAQRIEIEFTAPVDPLRVASSIKVDGQKRIWELLPDGRTLRLAESLSPRRPALKVVRSPKAWDSVADEIRPVLGASTLLRIQWLKSRGVELPK